MSAVRYQADGDVAVLTINFPPVNALSYAVRTGLIESSQRAFADPAVKVLLLIAEGRTFPAGADVSEFSSGKSMETPLPEVIDIIEKGSKPVISAVHGTALGGGLELTLGSHYRIALASAKFGLPEVNIGIIPGAGGTQRLPRLIPVEKAIELCTKGAHIPASQALKLGLIDRVIDSREWSVLLSEGIAFARSVAGAPFEGRRLCSRPVVGDASPAVFERARAALQQAARGQFSPLAALEAVQAATTVATFQEGMEAEGAQMMQCFMNSQSGALQYAFFAEREARKIPQLASAAAQPLPVRSCGVIGAGTMGAGIALCLLKAGIRTTLVDTKQEFLDRGMKYIEGVVEAGVRKGRMSAEAAAELRGRLAPALDLSALSSADLVIEAAFESMQVKRDLFGKLDRICGPHAILATNTSTLSIDEIAGATGRPEKVVGMHFFSPANVMRLLEVVKGARSSDATVATAFNLCGPLNKVGVLVGNCDGFVGNRMLARYGSEAMFLVEEGATPQQVDAALYEFGMSMGPFAMYDLAGHDIGHRIRQEKGLLDPATRPPGVRYCEIPDRLCELGRYGQKTQKGMYRYRGRSPEPDPEVEALLEHHRRSKGIRPRTIQDKEIVQRCIFALVNEGFKILEEGIALRPSDIDICYLYGYGFPRYRGGPMYYADLVGLGKVHAAILDLQAKHPDVPYWQPSPLLAELASSGKSLGKYWKKRNGGKAKL